MPFPVVCKNRKERIAAIGDAVAKSDYHIVALQEVGLTGCITKSYPYIIQRFLKRERKKETEK